MEYKITLLKSGVVSSYKLSQRAAMWLYVESLTDEGIAFSFEVVQS